MPRLRPNSTKPSPDHLHAADPAGVRKCRFLHEWPTAHPSSNILSSPMHCSNYSCLVIAKCLHLLLAHCPSSLNQQLAMVVSPQRYRAIHRAAAEMLSVKAKSASGKSTDGVQKPQDSHSMGTTMSFGNLPGCPTLLKCYTHLRG